MKTWMRMSLAAFVLVASSICTVIASSTGAPPHAHAKSAGATLTHTSTYNAITFVMWVNCQVLFLDGPQKGEREPDDLKVNTNGSLISYASSYVGGMSSLGSWSYTGSNTISYTFSADLTAVPGGHLTASGTFPTNTYPVVANAIGSVSDANGNLLFTTHATLTCPYFLPNTSPCSLRYTPIQSTLNTAATLTIEIDNTGTTTMPAGGTVVFVWPGWSAITSEANGTFSINGNTITGSNLPSISAGVSIFPSFTATWNGNGLSDLIAEQWSFNGIPCTLDN